MTNLHNDHQNNFASFLRDNQPLPPDAHPNFEQQLFDSLELRKTNRNKYLRVAWTIPSAIVTSFLFTSVSLTFRTPRIALEPKDLENFIVRNWQSTLGNTGYNAIEETEAQWLLPLVADPAPTLSVSTP
ncbi:MAG: hypothetical protein AAGE84_08415 [Cyanobacteria bacterium P01_G01_bin.39]